MGITGSIIVYVMIWWIIFFSVLPIGIRSNKEVFKEKIEGMDPGAPKNPKIGKKFLNICYLTLMFSLLTVGILMKFNMFYFMLLIIIFYQLFYLQLKKLKIHLQANCLMIFKSNNFVGLLIFISLIIGKI